MEKVIILLKVSGFAQGEEGKYVRLEGKKYAEERGGLCSQSLEKPQGLGFCFISDGEPWKALEQESVLFRLYY